MDGAGPGPVVHSGPVMQRALPSVEVVQIVENRWRDGICFSYIEGFGFSVCWYPWCTVFTHLAKLSLSWPYLEHSLVGGGTLHSALGEMDGLWWSNHHLVGGAVLVGGAHTSSVPTSTSLRTPTPSLMRGDHPVSGRRLITRIFVHWSRSTHSCFLKKISKHGNMKRSLTCRSYTELTTRSDTREVTSKKWFDAFRYPT